MQSIIFRWQNLINFQDDDMFPHRVTDYKNTGTGWGEQLQYNSKSIIAYKYQLLPRAYLVPICQCYPTYYTYIHTATVDHFTNDFSIQIQIQLKFLLALIVIMMNLSLQILAHAMTAVLSWHVLKFVAILQAGMKLQ